MHIYNFFIFFIYFYVDSKKYTALTSFTVLEEAGSVTSLLTCCKLQWKKETKYFLICFIIVYLCHNIKFCLIWRGLLVFGPKVLKHLSRATSHRRKFQNIVFFHHFQRLHHHHINCFFPKVWNDEMRKLLSSFLLDIPLDASIKSEDLGNRFPSW